MQSDILPAAVIYFLQTTEITDVSETLWKIIWGPTDFIIP
jgi:hypothetical protein